MTDIYVRRDQPSRRPIFIALSLIVLIIVGIVVYNLRNKSVREEQAEDERPEVTESVSETAEASPQESPVRRPEGLPPIRSETIPAPDPAAPQAVTPPRPSQPVSFSGDLASIQALASAGQYAEARSQVLAYLAENPSSLPAQQLAGEIHEQLLFSPRVMPEKVDYTVVPGDSLSRIAQKFNTTVQLLQKSNGIKGSNIRAGKRMRILQGTFSVLVDKSDNYLLLYLNGQFFKRYPVGTGEFGKTPVGTFKITDRIAQPTWWHPDGKAIPYGDPDNLLGTHWLALDEPGYGIHGTWEPQTIGKQASAGCVRLLNEDVEELYALLPLGTEVTIQE